MGVDWEQAGVDRGETFPVGPASNYRAVLCLPGGTPMNRLFALWLAIVLTFSVLAAAAPADQTAPKEPVKAKHDGSINDLEAIGNRNVGCGRGLSNWYSVEGRSTWAGSTPSKSTPIPN